VILHGLLGQEQTSGDLSVGLPIRDERHDLDLARGQPVRIPGPVENEPLVSAWPRDLAIVHLTSGCGLLLRTAANVPNKVGTASIHEGSGKSLHEPIWAAFVRTCTQHPDLHSRYAARLASGER
jgi:hypothetical protein